MIPQSMKNQISKDVIINGKSLHKELCGMMTFLAKLAFWAVQHLSSANNSIGVLHLWEHLTFPKGKQEFTNNRSPLLQFLFDRWTVHAQIELGFNCIVAFQIYLLQRFCLQV